MSVSPKSSGTLGGDLITLSGESFSVSASAVKVYISGTPCDVVLASMNKIICELAKLKIPPRAYTRTGQIVYPGVEFVFYGLVILFLKRFYARECL